jgi:UDP-N-acetylmuramyl pentapeptide phosphotransferase/UDP-N-acetylglucosamine-1-phosphate transferase
VSSSARILGRLAVAAGAAVAARALFAGAPALPEAAQRELERTNHRGETVTLASGPVLTVAATAAAVAGAPKGLRAAAAVAGIGAGAVGLYDDIVGARPDQKSDKGFRGHVAALREGRVSAGLVKVAGIGLAGLIAGRAVTKGQARGLIGGRAVTEGRARGLIGGRAVTEGRARGKVGAVADVLVAGGVVAGTANLVNLLDLRPGRAIKAGLLIGAPLTAGPAGGLVAGPVGAAAALIPEDLDERTMLGDSGANALGALLGLGLAASTGRRGRAALLAGLVALTAASEKVSFTKVIERTPVLRELDGLGRRAPAKTEPALGRQAPGETEPAQPGPAQPGPAQPGPAQPGPAEPGPAKAGPAKSRPAKTESTRRTLRIAGQ